MQAILAAQIGPFKFDHENRKLTMEPGTYILKQPLVVGMIDETKLINIEFIGHSSQRVEPKVVR